MHSNHRSEPRLLRYIVEGAAYDSARSLDLLRAIEATVHVNDVLYETFSQMTQRLNKAAEDICSPKDDSARETMDPNDEIRRSLEATMETLKEAIDNLVRRRGFAAADSSLRADDGVVDSFDSVIAAVSDAHNALNEVNWAIMEHDADLSPRSGKGPFKSIRDLIDALSE